MIDYDSIKVPKMFKDTTAAAMMVTCICVGMSSAVKADSVVVVPGRIAGYLYAPSSADASDNSSDRVDLAVFKLGAYYGYRLESEPAGLVCDESCSQKSSKVRSGRVIVKIGEDEPIPGLKLQQVGRWKEPCQNTITDSDYCLINDMTGLNNHVQVTVNPSGLLGREVVLSDGQAAILVELNTTEGYAKLARKGNLGSATWLEFNASRRNGTLSGNNGRTNTETLKSQGSKAAAFCANLAPTGKWYLPSKNELALMNVTTMNKAGVSSGDTVWSSTGAWSYVQSGVISATYRAEAWYVNGNGGSSSGQVFTRTINGQGVTTYDGPAVSRKVLCFQQLTF